MACVLPRGQSLCSLRGQTSVNSVTALLEHRRVLRSTSKKNEILYISHIMWQTVDALYRHKFGVVWEKDQRKDMGQAHGLKVEYQQTSELHRLSNFCQYSAGTPSTYSFSRKNSELLTTSFCQQGKAVFNAMDLPIQALRVDAKRVNIRNLSVILSAFVCLLPYIEGLISLGSADQKASVLYDTRDLSSTHFWRKKPCNCGLTRPRHQTSASQLLRLRCSFLGMDLKIHLLQEEVHSWQKDKLVGFQFLLTCVIFPCSGGWNLKAEAQVTLWAGESGKCVQSSNCNQMSHLHVDLPHPYAVPPRAPFTASSKGSWCFPMQR